MRRTVCLVAILMCVGCQEFTNSVDPIAEAMAAPKPSFDACAKFDPVNFPDHVADIISVTSSHTGTPEGVLYGHYRVESGEVYGDGGHSGECSAFDQYTIMSVWKSKAGEANLAALAHIADVTHRDIKTIKGSCGKSTKTVRGSTFGGALGPMQILAASWVSDSASKDKDVFNLCHAMFWAARHDRRYHDAFEAESHAPAPPDDPDKNDPWRFAVRKYYGSLDHSMSGTYFNKVVDYWTEWHDRALVRAQRELVFSVAEKNGRRWRNGVIIPNPYKPAFRTAYRKKRRS